MIKHYQIRNLYPLAGTIMSVALFVVYWDSGFNKFLSLVVTSLGIIIWWTATITLGKAFSLIPKASELIKVGIYSKIRHPIYVGLSLVGIGWALLTQTSLLILLAVATIVSSIIRAKLEETKLVKTFCEKYLNYKKETWF